MANLGEGECLPAGCQWRVLDPATGKDELLMQLAGPPLNVYWDRDQTIVHYRLGDKLYRLPWKFGAQSESILSLPSQVVHVPEAVVDIWRDRQNGAWRIKTLESIEGQPMAGVWEYSYSGGEWSVLKRIPTECECGDCPCANVVNDMVQPESRIALDELLEAMRVATYLERIRPGEPWNDGSHEIPSTTARDAAIRFEVALGDTYHAMAPLVYLGKARGEQKIIYGKNEPCYDQLAFQEDGGFLLVAAEFSGGCARVVAMHSGEILTTLAETSKHAVWINPPAR